MKFLKRQEMFAVLAYEIRTLEIFKKKHPDLPKNVIFNSKGQELHWFVNISNKCLKLGNF